MTPTLVSILLLAQSPLLVQSQFVWKNHLKGDNKTIEVAPKYLKMGVPTAAYNRRMNKLGAQSLDERCARGLGIGVGFQVSGGASGGE